MCDVWICVACEMCWLGDGSLLVADGRGLRRVVTQALRRREGGIGWGWPGNSRTEKGSW